MKPEVFTDLFEIIIHVDLQGVRARREKYWVKQTATNYLAQRITDEQHEQGYSHRMCSRVPVVDLMKVQTIGFGLSSDHIVRHGYCLRDQQKQLFNLLRSDIERALIRMRDNSAKLWQLWAADDTKLVSRVPEKDECQS